MGNVAGEHVKYVEEQKFCLVHPGYILKRLKECESILGYKLMGKN